MAADEGNWIRVEIARPLDRTNHDLIASKRTKLLPSYTPYIICAKAI